MSFRMLYMCDVFNRVRSKLWDRTVNICQGSGGPLERLSLVLKTSKMLRAP